MDVLGLVSKIVSVLVICGTHGIVTAVTAGLMGRVSEPKTLLVSKRS